MSEIWKPFVGMCEAYRRIQEAFACKMTNTKDDCVEMFYQLAVLLGCSLRSERNLTADWCRMADFRYPAGFPSASVPFIFQSRTAFFRLFAKNFDFQSLSTFPAVNVALTSYCTATSPFFCLRLFTECVAGGSTFRTKTSSSQSFCYTRFVDGSEIFKKILMFEGTGRFRKDIVYSANR